MNATVLVLGLSFALLSQAPKARTSSHDWPTVISEIGAFSCAMPGSAQKLPPDPNSGPKEVRFARSGGALYSVQVIPNDPRAPKSDSSGSLDKFKNQYLTKNGTTAVRESKVTLDGYPGRDFTFKAPSPKNDGLVTSRIVVYLAVQDFVVFTVMSPRDQPVPDSAETFFASISLKPQKSRAKSPSPTAIGTPESALRSFLIAIAFKDEKVVRDLALQTEGLEWLLKGQSPAAAQSERIRESFGRLPIRTLKPNETIKIPVKGGARTITIDPEETMADRAVLLPEGSPVPTRMRQIRGRWKVDAAPMIAARKAADAVREREKKAAAPKG